MEPTDLTIKILQEIRDEARGTRSEVGALRSELKSEIGALRTEMTTRFELADQRFLVIETTLKDLAGQMVTLARGVKTALETRSSLEARLDEYDRRIRALEERGSH